MRRAPRKGNLEKEIKTLLIDGNALFKTGYHGAINEYNDSGRTIGGIYQFIVIMKKLIEEKYYDRVFVFWDGKFSGKLRYDIYSDYKGNRKLKRITNWSSFDDLADESASMSQQMLRLIDYLHQLPVSIITRDKLEADDIIGYLAPKFDQAVIMSADQDFLQLCSDNVQVYSPIKKKFYGPKEVFDEYGLWPQNFVNYKVLMGDTSDNLPGVKGLGPKKLYKLFPELTGDKTVTLKEIIQKGYDKHEENGIYGNVWNFRKQLIINEQLMSLENPNIPDYDIEVLEELLGDEPYDLNQARFLQLHSSDLLERQISPNVEFWIQNNFLYLTKYKHK